MELYELRYFLGVAKVENIHRASEKLHVSPASLSKAISRLELELGVKLFYRERRNIRLTPQGRVLQRRASEMIILEESLRFEVTGDSGGIQVVIAGPEIFLANMGVTLGAKIKTNFPSAKFEFQATSEDVALEKVKRGEAHLAIVSRDVPEHMALKPRAIQEAKFQTYIGKGHPLYRRALANKIIPVADVLKYSFVSPDNPILGRVGDRQSHDGWRDDQFPRNVEYLTSSLKILEELVVAGTAIAYLPSYFAENLGLSVLKISGCPYSCVQKIKVVAKNPQDTNWLSQIFDL